ncbi:MAG: helix-turn-helix transcriptional regulator [Lachnospiraceae bacterium]|nr:helix-turn-helix transcriptional regulator [Lachnospiraceae bacterium]
MIDQIKIGGFLRELRREKGLTQEELAEKFGLSSRSVSRRENGV